MATRASALALLFMLAPACALFVDLNGLSNGDAPVDGGPAAEAGDKSDSASDAGTSPGTDAGTGSDADAGEPPTSRAFCEGSTAAFCDDFDLGVRPAVWTGETVGPAVLEPSPTSTEGHAPFVVRASVNGSTANADRARYAHAVSGTPIGYRWSYDLFVDQWPTSGSAEINTIGVTSSDGPSWMFLQIQAGSARIKEESNIGGVFMSETPFAQTGLTAQRWHRVSLEVRLEGAAPTFSLSVDGVGKGSAPVKLLRVGTLTVAAGIDWTAATTTIGVRVDNVVFEVLP